ncbi:MAG: hypothetical protein Q9159_006685 [Coniocarpon cinnabarinum]
MLIKSPTELHYPITVATLRKRVNDPVKRQEALFEYSYRTKVTEQDQFGGSEEVDKTFYGTFESAVDGTLRSWVVQKGNTISGPSSALAEVEEECTHSVQYGGMCVECGKDLTTMDYTTAAPETIRASTTVTPNHQALRISDEEAARSDMEAKQRLIDHRKLSLVVDLDLTIIHASVDPTIKEWMDDERNPNHPAVEDVCVFELFDDALGRNVSYFIKLRPNLYHFLQKMSKLYELHIYTMGTRAYAENIAKLVDPDRKLFGERILSRTETPGEISKNLRKLFPVDNRMVVIIDDRADVWNWSNYLVRVQPFNFFVGIGDINSSFLPKQEDAPKPSATPKEDSPTKATEDQNGTDPEHAPDESDIGPIKLQRSPTSSSTDLDSQGDQPNGDESALGQMVSMQESNDASEIQRKTQEQDETLAAQLNERPLMQLQKSLEKEQEEAAASIEEEDGAAEGIDELAEGHEQSVPMERARSASRPPIPQTLLKDDDTELHRIEAMLEKIQNTFYNIFDERMEEQDYNVPGPSMIPDVKDVIERHRFLPLRGSRVVFSRLVPRHIDIMKTRWADMAMRLGAVVQGDISYRSQLREDTTHLVCKPGDPTDKMKEAASLNIRKRKRNDDEIRIVSSEWLLDSVSQWWQHVDEAPYLVYVEPPKNRRRSSGTADDEGFSDAMEASANASDAGGMEMPEVGEDDAEDEDDAAPDDDGEEDGHKSLSEDEAEWAEAFASDDDDEDFSDSDGEAEETVNAGTAKVNGSRIPSKRKHEEDSDKGSDSDASSVGSSQGSSAKVRMSARGPALQRRKKRALERTTSLTQVTNVSASEGRPGEGSEGGGGEAQDAMEAAMMEALDEALEGEGEA